MMRKPSQIVHCISCDLSCQLFPDSAVRVQYCHNAAFSIWFIEKLLLDRH
ncbi:RmbA, partial [Salmonella enterica subsp. enterica serovar Alachua str. R6-377]